MVKVGILGLGSMGLTHLDAYGKRTDAQVVAVSDKMVDRLEGRARATGNIDGQAQGTCDFSSMRKYAEGMDLIRDPEVELIDICLPTPLHVEYAVAALGAGKHVMVEKPLARTAADAARLAKAAESARGFSMVGMCMRFWPGWTWLKQAVVEGTYGKVMAAYFRRVANHPGGAFYRDGAACGGALLDLHIHDTDFVQYLFGMPSGVYSAGYTKVTGELDHLVTHYRYPGVPLVVAEGGWAMSEGFGFRMQYTVNFERATAVFDLAAPEPLTLIEPGRAAQAVKVEAGMGYEHEIGYFVECIRAGRRPDRVTMADAERGLRILEAERESARTGRVVTVD